MQLTRAIGYRIVPVMVLALAAGLTLGGCSGGGDAMTQPTLPAPAADLDTTKTPPQTVTSMPLLPPVPEDHTPGQSSSQPPAEPPMQYDHLYSDDEQTKIQTDLIAAAAHASRN